ncbi:AraC family transcriptional regulator [Flagellimonas algicola]|uniref:AraC family transcriptional regulator n=1 Tax=Flagellimonas algicola TaxID=2583815 RepID=A0ABY2WML7_9FLAO|nr:AraC family transcriptional regulator [Allomuricauda algicola]TMU56252.1 AraC family transcriptional regulator [Allomuricauda algicola]
MLNQTKKRKVFHLPSLGYPRFVEFGHYHYRKVEPTLEAHQHQDVVEICFCIRGQQYYELGEHLLKLRGNDILIVPPNQNHSSGVYPEDIGELYWLQIHINHVKGQLCHLPTVQSEFLISALQDKAGGIFKGALVLKSHLQKLIGQLESEQTTLTQLTTNQLLIQLLLETLELSQTTQIVVPSERVKIIDEFIAANLHRIIYVDELAELVNFSTAYFKSWFKQHFGAPPKAYINRLKIERAKEELLKNNTITEVAYNLGFSTSQYFATTFKKFTGMSPKVFRMRVEKP